MGTGFHMGFNEEEVGIVPRAVEHLFNGIEARRQAAIEKGEPPPEFKVLAQFMEVRRDSFVRCCQTRQPFPSGRDSPVFYQMSRVPLNHGNVLQFCTNTEKIALD